MNRKLKVAIGVVLVAIPAGAGVLTMLEGNRAASFWFGVAAVLIILLRGKI